MSLLSHLLNPSSLAEVGAMVDTVLETRESRTHQANDAKCSAYGAKRLHIFFASVIFKLVIPSTLTRFQVSFNFFSTSYMFLIRANTKGRTVGCVIYEYTRIIINGFCMGLQCFSLFNIKISSHF